jgi:hypothetical protein
MGWFVVIYFGVQLIFFGVLLGRCFRTPGLVESWKSSTWSWSALVQDDTQ